MTQVSLVDVFLAAQPSPTHAAAVEHEGEGAFDLLGAELERLTGDTGGQAGAIVGDGVAGLIVAVPA